MIKLVGIDLDGTLLTDDKQICQRNIQAIRKAIDQGVKIVLCSGRSPDGMKTELETLQLKQEGQYGIGLNGGLVFQTKDNKVLHKGHLPQEAAEAIILRARQINDEVNLQLYNGEDVFVERWDHTTELYRKATRSHATLIPDLMKLSGEVVKIGLFRRAEIDPTYQGIQEIKAKMVPYLLPGTTAAISAPYLVEFYSENTHKGAGIEILRNILEIKKEETMGIGDLENDLPMITGCGVGVAMANAVAPVKEVADYITTMDNNEGGVAEAIERFVLR